MKRYTYLYSLAVSLLMCTASYADNGSQEHHLAEHQICQDGILNPSSPEMWTMFHFGDNFTADPNQGTLGLSIPIFHYTDERFDIPVELCYNTAGGYRPNVQAGPFGLGWTLSCLGAITREVRGIADEEGYTTTDMYSFKNKFHHYDDTNLSTPKVFGWGSVYDTTYVVSSFPGGYSHDIRHGYFRDFAFTGKAGAEYMPIWTHSNSYNYTRPSFETLPDIFHFCFLGRSGSFVLQPGGQVVVYGTADSPHNYKVTANLSRTANGFESFSITTENNYVYTFGGSVGSVEYSSSSDGINSTSDLSLASSWRLRSIESPDGRTVVFTYGDSMTTRTVTPTHTYDLVDYYSTYIDPVEQEPPSDEFRNVLYIQDTPTTSEVQALLLTRIDITGRAEIVFSYGTACAEQGAEGTSAKKLEGVLVRSVQSNSTIRSAALSYHLSGTAVGDSYPSSGSGVTLLSSLYIPGEGRWSMHYDSETGSFPSMNTRAIDWMGYYNGNTQQDSYSPAFCPSLEAASNPMDRGWMLSLRQGNLSYARMGMLSSISYPTGGRSDFEYELNDYSSDLAYERPIPSGAAPGYGIRIFRILNRDADGLLKNTRIFTYANTDGSSSGTLLWRPTLYSHYEMRSYYFNKITRTTLSTTDSFPYSRGVFTEYTRVLETILAGPGNTGAAVTERTYDSYNAGTSRDYTENWEDNYYYLAENGWYYYLMGEDPATHISRQEFNTWLQSRHGGKLLSETEYSGDLYHPVRKTLFAYNTYSQSASQVLFADMQYGFLLDFCLSLQDPWMSQTITTDYSPSGTIILTSTRTNTLDSDYRLATVSQNSSDGGNIVTSYEWLSSCPAMLSRYTVTRNGHLSEGVRRLYETVTGHPKLFVPVTVQSADPGSSASSPTWRTEQTCHVWSSRGLPLEICDKSGIPTAVVWGWDGMYPAAKVTGKLFSDIVSVDSSFQGGVLEGNLSNAGETALRTLSTAVVNTYRWSPLVGLIQTGTESGKKTGYNYDSAGRLSSVENDSGNTLVSYLYDVYTDNQ